MKRLAILLATLAMAVTPPVFADHDEDVHSANMTKLATFDDGTYQDGSDIAFWENYAVFGNLSPGGFRLLDISNPAKPVKLSQFTCNGTQSDVSIWEDLVFVSVDGPRASDACNATAATSAGAAQGAAFEGIRIVSIEDPANPVQIKTVDTLCGSHTHTLVPDLANNRLLIYVSSYPLTAVATDCNHAQHSKISVIEVPLDAPTQAKVVSTPSVSPALGCHDITVLMAEKLAGAACISESQLWDITDPVNPTIIGRIRNPLINIHHSAAFSWDGNTLVLGDELGGAAAAAGCLSDAAPLGALWFYDVSNPASPVMRGQFVIPRQHVNITCTAHNFNIIPLTTDKDVLVTAWYTGGTAVIDFTDPANPTEVGHYEPQAGEAAVPWSSYWYNGAIYANNYGGGRGVDVFTLDAAIVDSAVELPHMNAQAQEPFTVASASRDDDGGSTVLGERETLPATGVGGVLAIGLALGVGALATTRWLRRA